MRKFCLSSLCSTVLFINNKNYDLLTLSSVPGTVLKVPHRLTVLILTVTAWLLIANSIVKKTLFKMDFQRQGYRFAWTSKLHANTKTILAKQA